MRTLITLMTQRDRQNNDETIRFKRLRLWDIVGSVLGAAIVCGLLAALIMAVVR